MTKGDIVLIAFPFTDLSGSKLRPAVVLAQAADDITVCFMTSRLESRESTDVAVEPNESNGIKKRSLIRTGKIATLDRSLAKGLLGVLGKSDISILNENLKVFLQIS